MKITNEHRADFVRKVIAALPIKAEMTRAKLTAAIEKRCYEALPAAVKKMMKEHPKAFNRAQGSVRVEHPYAGLGIAHGREADTHDWVYYSRVVTEEVEALKFDDLVDQYKLYLDELGARRDLREELAERAAPCTTLNKLKDKFPDLVSFMPREVQFAIVPLVPDTTIMDKLLAAGLKKEA